MLTRKDLYEKLCSYDIRNPYRALLVDDDDLPGPAEKSCHCDNCFYGRHALADALLDAWDRIEELE